MVAKPLTLSGLAALAATALLTGCAPGLPETASRGDFRGFEAPVQGIHIVPVTAQNIARFAAMTATADAYLPGVGDVLSLHVVDEPDLTLPAGYTIEADGMIEVPYLGRIPAADRPLEALRDDLVARLRAYMPQPQVFVRIIGFNARHATVVGAVTQPRRQTLTDTPVTVIDAINAAGGFADPTRTPTVTLMRGGRAIPVDIAGFLASGRALPVLRDGDVVQVAQGSGWLRDQGTAATAEPRIAIYSNGQSRIAALPEGATLSQLSAVGATVGHDLYVLRRDAGAITALYLGAGGTDPAVGGRFALLAGDTVAILPPHVNPEPHLVQALRAAPQS